jgi:hypothetical protein
MTGFGQPTAEDGGVAWQWPVAPGMGLANDASLSCPPSLAWRWTEHGGAAGKGGAAASGGARNYA